MRQPQEEHTEHTTLMEQLIEKYSFLSAQDALSLRTNLGSSDTTSRASSPTDKAILLTGTTGNLGSDLLASLLSDLTVRKVYALNRASDLGPSRDRVGEQFSEKGLPQHLLDSPKCIFIDGKLTDPRLGLGDGLYEELCREVTIVIHNAWRVGHTAPLIKFEPSILGLHNLLNFTRCIPSNRNPRFIFVSSTASMHLWRLYEKTLIPEDLVSDARVATGFGYAESKFVGENVVARSGLNATSLRVTQLSGRLGDGAWLPTEWVPMMFKIMQEVRAIPATLIHKRFPFVPLDAAAHCIRDISLSPHQLPPALNVTHPRPFDWSTVGPIMQRLIWGTKPMPVLPMENFVELVERDLIANMPGPAQRQMKMYLRDFISPGNPSVDETSVEHFPVPACSTERTEHLSPTLRNLRRISTKDCESWAKYWIRTGFLEPEPGAHMEARL